MLLRFGNSSIPQKKIWKLIGFHEKKKKKKFHTKKIDFLQSCVFVQLQMHTPIVVGYGLNEYVVVSNSRSGKKVNFQCGSLHSMLGIYQATSILYWNKFWLKVMLHLIMIFSI